MLRKRMVSGRVLLGWVTIVVGILFCQTALAQGFTPSVLVNDDTTGGQDTDGKQLIAVLGDSVYVVWNDRRAEDTTDIYFAKSINGGETFGASVKVSNIPDTVHQLFPSLAVDNSGVIYVAWTVVSIDYWTGYGIWFAKSTNGGASFEPAVRVDSIGVFPTIAVYGNNVYVLYVDPSNYPFADIYFARSTNGGASFKTPYQVNDVPCQDTVDFSGMTALCVDASGNIYATWTDGRRANGNSDIYFAKSTNDGVSFGANVSVNDTTSPAGDSVQSYPTIAVGGSDSVYVTWHDHRGGDWKIYFAKSTNGGASFDADILVSDTINTTDGKYPAISTSASGLIYIAYGAYHYTYEEGIWCAASNNGGESFGNSVAVTDIFSHRSECPSIAVGSDEKSYVVWNDDRIGDKDIYFAKGTVVGIEEGDDNHQLTISNYQLAVCPNPFSKKTVIKLASGTGHSASGKPMTNDQCPMTISIYDLVGRLIRTFNLCNQDKSVQSVSDKSVQSVVWEGKDDKGVFVPSGLYFCQLKSAGDIKKVRKILLLR